MSNWRNKILKKFPRNPHNLTIVADPDGILQDTKINNKLRKQGYNILYYPDTTSYKREKYSFRYRFESKYRKQWQKENGLNLLLAFKSNKREVKDIIPYDIWIKGKKIQVSLSGLFPKINHTILSNLEPSYIDRIYQAYQLYQGPTIGEVATKKYVLTTGYKLNPDNILTINDLTSNLLRIHYTQQNIPENLQEYLINHLKKSHQFYRLPLEQLFNKEKFYHYLQTQWEKYVLDTKKNTSTSIISFEDPEIMPYIDNLFTQGNLSPVNTPNPNQLPKWMHIGLQNTHDQDNKQILAKILDNIEAQLQSKQLDQKEWQNIATKWAQAITKKIKIGNKISPKTIARYKKIHKTIENKFTKWILNHHPGLHNLRLENPVTVSHICDYLHKKTIKKPDKKIALVVLDGLSIDQWIILEETINTKKEEVFTFDYQTVYAEIPTLTSISRQAIFSGKNPFYLQDTISYTNYDEKHWTNYWENHNINAGYIGALLLDNDKEIEKWQKLFSYQIIGIVVNFIDETMHGAKLGTPSVHDAVIRWITEELFVNLLCDLFNNGYDVFLTSDHGNIESQGIGKPRQGLLVEQAGSRVRMYSDPEYAKKAMKEYPETIIWRKEASGHDYTYLFPKGTAAFTRKNTRNVSHGGITIEEVIVPFVQVRKDNEA